ncbi:MAG: hypothetical protein ACR2LV_02860 [Solirubrobacteraceae bacterium]
MNTWAQDFALRVAPVAAGVANFCDHVEHNEIADRAWVIDAGAYLRLLACDQALAAGFSPIQLYAERLGDIEARNILAHPGGYDGHRAALEASTWRELQLVQAEHDRHYHPDVLGLAKDQQLRHYALHLTKIVGAFAEPRGDEELLHRRLPDALLFAIKLSTVMSVRLPDEPFPAVMPLRRVAAEPVAAR